MDITVKTFISKGIDCSLCFGDIICFQDVRSKYQHPPNLTEEDDTDMPYDERQMATGEAVGDITNSYQSVSHDQMNKRL